MKFIDRVAESFLATQENICQTLEQADSKAKFSRDNWGKDIGGGLTRVLQEGKSIEKAAVNFSLVKGKYSPTMEKLLGEKAENYAATGVSSIIHPRNAHVPIIHMNIRYFTLNNGIHWFGGGIDLTPHYINKLDAAWFHRQLKDICDKYNADFYARFKKWADDYFYIEHRNETRGVGGIFFDRLKPENDEEAEHLLKFALDLGNAYGEIYAEMIHRNSEKSQTEQEKKWQKLRRGRYVEFNLVYDRGTKFGLESGGNIESILLSMPPKANWDYNFVAEKGSKEEATLNGLKKNIDWLKYEA